MAKLLGSGMHFWHLLESKGSAVALVAEGQSISYSELTFRSDTFSAQVRARLPSSLTRPLILLETANEPDAIIAYLGVLRAGWPVILVAEGAGNKNSAIFLTFQPNVFIRKNSGLWQVDVCNTNAIAMHPDLAVLLSTSGTTGAAKLVRLSAGNLEANAEAISAYLLLRPDDRSITTLPFHYSYGMSVLHIHLRTGASIVLTDGSIIDPKFRELAHLNGVTSLALVPTQFELLRDTHWLPKLRYITQAGGRLDPTLARQFSAQAQEEGWQLFIMYGQTEAAPRMSYVPPEDAREWFHTIGRPIPGGAFRLIDTSGANITSSGVTGELVYEGPNVMLGYASSSADLAAPAGPSVLYTGDLAERLPNEYFRIVGRSSRFLKLFGLRVGLDELETQLRTAGNRVYVSGTDQGLVVFLTDASDPQSLRHQIAETLKLPQSSVIVQPVAEVPLMSSGKIDYRALAIRAEQVQLEQVDDSSIEAYVQSVLRVGKLDIDQSFLDLGGDSLAYLEMQLHLSSSLSQVPPDWERLPLRQLFRLERSAAKKGKTTAQVAVSIDADLLTRVTAVFAVIALHSTSWPTGGGAYVLLILTGYSLARFQYGVLFQGNVFRTWVTMLIPMLVCYFLLIAMINLFWAPVGIEWFFLIANFEADIQFKGLIPYWFVSTYTQIIVIFTLPFLFPSIRHRISHHPFAIAVALLLVMILIIHLFGIYDITADRRQRHPLAALELVLVGWCICLARKRSEKIFVTLVGLVVWWTTWRDVNSSTTMIMLLGSGAIIWGFKIESPRWLAKGFMWIGSMSLFIYLVHVPIVSVVTRLASGPNILVFVLAVGLSVLSAFLLKATFEWAEALFAKLNFFKRGTLQQNQPSASTQRIKF